jgi:hypothetical protein
MSTHSPGPDALQARATRMQGGPTHLAETCASLKQLLGHPFSANRRHTSAQPRARTTQKLRAVMVTTKRVWAGLGLGGNLSAVDLGH